MVSVRRRRPSPLHVGQTLRILPVPPQRVQGTLNFILPAACWMVPEPWQVGQVCARADRARAVAGVAGIEARDGQLLDGAANGIPKVDFDLIFEVAAGLMLRFFGSAAAAREKLAEEIAETRGAALRARAAAEIKAAKIKIDAFAVLLRSASRPAGRNVVAVKAVLVVHLTLLRIGEDVVGFLQLLEFFFGGFVAGIQVGMVFAREFAESSANVFRAGFLRDA